jgi:hypothetical protein
MGNRDSSVGIATRYGLEDPGIEFRWCEIFRTYPDRLRGPPSLLYNGYRGFTGSKGGRGVMPTTPPLLMPRLRKSWAIPPLTLWVLLGLLRGSLYPLLHKIYKHIYSMIKMEPKQYERMWYNYESCKRCKDIQRYCLLYLSVLCLHVIIQERLNVIKVFYLPTDAQQSCFKRILKFALKQLLHVSVQSPSSGSVLFELVKVIVIKIIS